MNRGLELKMIIKDLWTAGLVEKQERGELARKACMEITKD